jgi:TetR/AcrR family transcriptional regulator, lmrAB and yxaGH operons repressor
MNSPVLRQASRAPDAVVTAVARCFRKLGYEGASMTVLAQATGLGRSSLYHHFPGGKEEMAQAALDRVEAFLRDDLGAVLSSAGVWDERQSAMLARLDLYYESGELGCLLGSLSLQDAPPEVGERVRVLTEYWIETLAAFMAERGDPQPRRTAERGLALIQGALIMSAATRDKTHFRNAIAEF